MPLHRLECSSKKSSILPCFLWWQPSRTGRAPPAAGGGRSVSDGRPPRSRGKEKETMKRTSMTVYDYNDVPQIIKLPDKEITMVHVCVLSGDETGYVQFSDNTIMEFDASTCRMLSFYDGRYTVAGDDNLAKWFDWEPEGMMLSYERQGMMSREE